MSFQRGVEAYQNGEHYEAHEHWEELWQAENDEQRRRFFQGLIQMTSAVHKAVHDVAPRGSLRLLDAAVEKLAGLGEAFFGVDLGRLRSGIATCRAEIARQLEANEHCRLDPSFAPSLVQLGAAPLLPSPTSEPLVPGGARRAWFERGLDAYAAGDFFEAHELWEELWRDAPRGFDRQFLQGLIQVAAALHKQRAHDKPAAAARLLGRAIDKLDEAPPGYRGLDTARLLREARRAQTLLEAGRAIDDTQIPAIRRVDS